MGPLNRPPMLVKLSADCGTDVRAITLETREPIKSWRHRLRPHGLHLLFMYEFDWSIDEAWANEARASAPAFRTGLARDRVERTMLTFWGEHCLECAPPH